MQEPQARFGQRIGGAIVLALPVAIGLLGFCMAQPPRPLPATAPATEFSAERALEHSRRIAVEPHPAGSAAQERVRDYLVGALKGMGWEVQVQEATIAEDHSASTVQNVLARLPGQVHTRGFALVSHYDSVATGPGAADDGAGVVSLLETARALRAGPPLRNDILLVFTGDEEAGMRGARAFTEHPWGKGVGAMLNLEARGTSGPSYMFETSPGNGWLIRELCRSGAPAFANSLMYEFYSRMPTDSDFTSVLKGAGYPGYNFAFIANITAYHNVNDSVTNLNPHSLQNHGECALALARHFGNLPDEAFPATGGAGTDEIYFNSIGPRLVHYPASWSRPLELLSALLLVAALGFGLAKGRFKVRDILAGMAALPAAALAVAVSGGILVGIAYLCWGFYLLYNATFYTVSLLLVTVAITLVAYGRFSRRTPVLALAAGAMIWWLAVVILLGWLMPGGAYFAMWPLLFGGAGLLLWCWLPAAALQSPGRLALMSVFALPVLLFAGPGLQAMLLSCTVLPSPVFLPLLVLMLGVIIPQMVFAAQQCGPRLAAGLAAVGILLFGIGLGTNGPSASRPRMDGISYYLDLDRQVASWICRDRKLDEWTSQFIPAGAARGLRPELLTCYARFRTVGVAQIEESPLDRWSRYWRGPAPVAVLTGPALEVVRDQATNGVRHLTLRLSSARKAPRVDLVITPPVKVLAATVNGKALKGGQGAWPLDYVVFPRSGVAEVEVQLGSLQALSIAVTEISYDLPSLPGIRPRPPHLIPRPNTIDWFESVLYDPCMAVVKTFAIPAAGVDR
jgi:hypothetical protein